MAEGIELFFGISLAIFLEAIPFLLLGSVLGALLEFFVSPERLERLLPKSRVVGVLAGLMGGVVLPTCECGVVPIAKRLLHKGASPSFAITYMLAAPVINPVVIASTYVAFQGSWAMVGGRCLLVGLTAGFMGLFLGRHPAGVLLLAESTHHKTLAQNLPAAACCHEHHEACCHEHHEDQPRLMGVLLHAGEELLGMSRFLLLGCLAAAAFKTWLPPYVVNWFTENIWLSILGMMFLSVLLSVCSEADAFVAAGFSQFPMVAQLSFLSLGPMFDLKLLAMFSSVFKRPVVLGLSLLPFIMVFCLSLVWVLVENWL
jgi:hypothetical protein